MTRCKHGIDPETCSYCTGLYDQRVARQDKRVTLREFRVRIRELQEESKIFATRHAKNLTDEEIRYTILNTYQVSLADVDIMYKIARKWQRTLYSIQWIWNYAWGNQSDENRISPDKIQYFRKIQGVKLALRY